MSRSIGCLLLAGAAIGFSSLAPGEEPGGATVSATGVATVSAKPEALRVEVQISARAKTLETALERLKARREAAMKKLTALEAESDSINFGQLHVTKAADLPCYAVPILPGPAPSYPVPVPYTPGDGSPPTLPPPATAPGWTPAPSNPLPPTFTPSAAPPSTTPPPSSYQPANSNAGPTTAPSTSAAAAVLSAMADAVTPSEPPSYSLPVPAGAIAPRIEPPPMYYTVTVLLSADWKLVPGSDEEMLIAAESLKGKIEAADLPGLKDRAKLPPEEMQLIPGAASPVPSTVYVAPSSSYSSTPTLAPVHPYPVPAGLESTLKFLYVARVSDQQRKTALAEAFAKAKTQAAELAEAAGAKLGAVRSANSYNTHLAAPCTTAAYEPYADRRDAEFEVTSESLGRIVLQANVNVTFHLQ